MTGQSTPDPSLQPPSDMLSQRYPAGISGLFKSRNDNIDLLKALFFGTVITAFFYEVFPVPFIDQGRVLALFDNSISEIITGMTFWSLFILLFKYMDFRLQVKSNQAFADPSIQSILTEGVYARNVDDVLLRMKDKMESFKVKKYEYSVIFRRVSQVLHYIRSLPKKESLNAMLEYQSNIDVKKLESGYTILQVFIWAIPILGFIGTVMGIGESVSNFSVFIQTAETGAQFGTQMRNALGGVTSGLAVAFNTTFLALVLVIPVMIITSFLQKSDENILLTVEEYCLDELLPHLHISPSNDVVTENFDEHLHRILQLSNSWLGQLEPLVDKLSRQTEMVSHQIGGIQPLVKKFTDQLLADDKGENPAGPPTKQPPAKQTPVKAVPVAAARAKASTVKSKTAKTKGKAPTVKIKTVKSKTAKSKTVKKTQPATASGRSSLKSKGRATSAGQKRG